MLLNLIKCLDLRARPVFPEYDLLAFIVPRMFPMGVSRWVGTFPVGKGI